MISAIAIPPMVMIRKRNGENRSEELVTSAGCGVLGTLVFTLFTAISLMLYSDFVAKMEQLTLS